MVTRTWVLLLVGALLGGCGADPENEVARDMLFLHTSSGVAIVEAGAGSPTYSGTAAMPSPDWSTMVQTTLVQKQGATRSTRIDAVDPSTGYFLWQRTVPGRLRVKVVSSDGNLVALADRRERSYISGRRRTRLLIVDGRTATTRTITVAKNLEPEAFSTDGKSLFVLLYTPRNAPTNYQVRRLDLATERLMEVYTPDAHLQERMRGTARIQAMSPDGSRLYTLYTLGRAKNAHAFIHTLDLDELWAHCIDLPHEFARANEFSTDITLSADGKHLYIADSAAGAVAEIDTRRLEMTKTAAVNFGRGYPTHVLSAEGGGLYLTSGRNFTSLDPATLLETRSRKMDQRITGVQSGSGGQKLYVGLRRRVEVIDPATGFMLASLDPPGVGRIGLMGRGSRVLTNYQYLSCAC
jgi:DNA-binding beta-propeller fold protein YncE